ncbi:endonuclease domain-containing protein [Jannaschia sp. LMIT008]|uniref:endonuclease domain-containing protein n=1 Tax=Jannaschia maritima TaxID=3032585 RepID=UPI00281234E1|nr:endonuclease domain-containing protein [Jannaschia sp. LMIT008]
MTGPTTPTPTLPRGGRESGRVARARALRANATEMEKRLWQPLRTWRTAFGLHVRRQVPIGPFIVDFAILKERLVIEIDGGQHGGPDDRRRDAWLAANGHRIVRFWNSEVAENLGGVLETIFAATSASRATQSPPPRGEG